MQLSVPDSIILNSSLSSSDTQNLAKIFQIQQMLNCNKIQNIGTFLSNWMTLHFLI